MARPSILKLFWELDVDKVTLFPYVADAPISSTIPPGTNFMYFILVLLLRKLASVVVKWVNHANLVLLPGEMM